MTIRELNRMFPLLGLKECPWQVTEDAEAREIRRVCKLNALDKGAINWAHYQQYVDFCKWMDANGHTVEGANHPQGGVLVVNGALL